MKAKSVFFFPNGNTACCDEHGEQIGELQKSWLLLWIDHMEKMGFNPEDLKEIHLPSGMVKLIKIDDEGKIRYNWQSK